MTIFEQTVAVTIQYDPRDYGPPEGWNWAALADVSPDMIKVSALSEPEYLGESDQELPFTVTYKGNVLNYDFFYELCDFVGEVDNLDCEDDFAEIERIAQKLDAKASERKYNV